MYKEDFDSEKGMYYATGVLKRSDKQRMSSFLKRNGIKALIASLGGDVPNVILKVRGGLVKNGTWMCEPLYLELIKWATPEDYSEVCKYLGKNECVYEVVRPELVFGEKYVRRMYPLWEVVEQYPVFDGKYRIDWYIPELKLAIEFDELDHYSITALDRDELRQKEIEEELGCTFIRFKYDYKTGQVH